MWWEKSKMAAPSKSPQFLLVDEKFHSYRLNRRNVLMHHFMDLWQENEHRSSRASGTFFPQKTDCLTGLMDGLLKDTNTVLSKLNSPFLPLPLIAFHVWPNLFGEPLVLSELGLCITCSPVCDWEKKKQNRVRIRGTNNKQTWGSAAQLAAGYGGTEWRRFWCNTQEAFVSKQFEMINISRAPYGQQVAV